MFATSTATTTTASSIRPRIGRVLPEQPNPSSSSRNPPTSRPQRPSDTPGPRRRHPPTGADVGCARGEHPSRPIAPRNSLPGRRYSRFLAGAVADRSAFLRVDGDRLVRARVHLLPRMPGAPPGPRKFPRLARDLRIGEGIVPRNRDETMRCPRRGHLLAFRICYQATYRCRDASDSVLAVGVMPDVEFLASEMQGCT